MFSVTVEGSEFPSYVRNSVARAIWEALEFYSEASQKYDKKPCYGGAYFVPGAPCQLVVFYGGQQDYFADDDSCLWDWEFFKDECSVRVVTVLNEFGINAPVIVRDEVNVL